MSKSSSKKHITQAEENFLLGKNMIKSHPMFATLERYALIRRYPNNPCPDNAWAIVTSHGEIYVHPKRRGEPENWMYVLAHCLLHLGLGHFPVKENATSWNVACDCYIAKFLSDLKIGKIPDDFNNPRDLTNQTEEKLYNRFLQEGIRPEFFGFGTADNLPDMIDKGETKNYRGRKVDWQGKLAAGMALAVTSAVNVAAGYSNNLGDIENNKSTTIMARNWFINSYPLMGAMAANFKIIEDPILCNRMDISVAAINMELSEIYVNPAAALTFEESKFVLAHEFLHAGLRHETRAKGRDSYYWNIACDYVINGWLVEMGIGNPPQIGLLHDKELYELSAESIYDRIVSDIRLAKRLSTLRGVGLGDILGTNEHDRNWWQHGEGITLDEFYRNSLSQGLVYHTDQGRGYLPEGLIEEIRALSHPPIAWDVELAKWFDTYFAPLEKTRSYARLSRRQSSTPDIPRASWVKSDINKDSRTFGVLLDTSGSMSRQLLAKALGAIASYSISKDVYAVRVVFCDAAAYDQGYMRPEDIAQTVKVKGRGGTVLQPAIDLLEQAENFPKDAPLLIITDGGCDVLNVKKREHAYLIPHNAHLPFIPKGKVFRVE